MAKVGSRVAHLRSLSWRQHQQNPRQSQDSAGQHCSLLVPVDDLATLRRALFGATGLYPTLSLARILCFARVSASRATSLTFAGVDPCALHDIAGCLVSRPCHQRTAGDQARHCARNHETFPECVHRHTSIKCVLSDSSFLYAPTPDGAQSPRSCLFPVFYPIVPSSSLCGRPCPRLLS